MHSKRQVPIAFVLLPLIVGSVWATALTTYVLGTLWVTLFGVWYAYGVTLMILLVCLLKIWRKLD